MAVANIFRYTLEDCNRIMFILKEYIDKNLVLINNSDDRKYFNYYLYLEIFENRTEETLQELLRILKEYNVRSNEKATKLTCFYYTYLNRNIKEKGFHKGIEDISKIELYCSEVIEYLLKYKQLFRLMYKENYEISLKNRLKRIKDCLFETTLVGFDEIDLRNSDILKLKEKGIYDLSIFMINFYKSIYNDKKDVFYKNIFEKICHLDVLHPIFDRNKSTKGEVKLSYPYNFFQDLYGNQISEFLSIYKQIKEKGYGKVFEKFVDNNIEFGVSPRRREIVFKRIKNNMTFEEISKEFDVGGKRIRQLYIESLRKFRHPMYSKKFLKYPILYIEEYIKGVS